MRIFRDLELVESLGSGMGYIMQKYGRDNFIFLDNFIRMTVPYITKDREGQAVDTAQVAPPVTPSVAPQVEAQLDANPTSNPTSSLQVHRLLSVIKGDMPRSAIMGALSLKDRVTFTEDYLRPVIRLGLIEMSQPDSPHSPTQKYRLTAKGLAAKEGIAPCSK